MWCDAVRRRLRRKGTKAVAKVTDALAEHWIHLRTTNPIESTFATVRLRAPVTKGPRTRAAGVAMAFKLIESAQARWRAVNSPHLVALVRAARSSRTASSSNDPTKLEVTRKLRDTPIHTS
jgi:hypothetical protein